MIIAIFTADFFNYVEKKVQNYWRCRSGGRCCWWLGINCCPKDNRTAKLKSKWDWLLLISLFSVYSVAYLTTFQKQQDRWKVSEHLLSKSYDSPLPTRATLLDQLQDGEHDILIVGGGATGCGIALDAASRGNVTFKKNWASPPRQTWLRYFNVGLKTALVEKFDYASGTSSRSTKLIHGGVRYLQKAIMGLDKEQVKSLFLLMFLIVD